MTRGTGVTVKILVILEPDEGGYHAYCPALKGLHVGGDSKEEALDHARDGIILYLNSLTRHGEPLPVGPGCVIEKNRPRVQSYKPPRNAILENLEVLWQPTLAMSGAS